MNGQVCSDMVVDVRERRKGLGKSEGKFSRIPSATLFFFGHFLKSIVFEKSLFIFLFFGILFPRQSPLLGHSPVLLQPGVLWLILALMWGIHLPSGYQSCRLGITCSYVYVQAPLV